MDEPSILEKLESGVIDFDTAYSSILAKVSKPSYQADAHAPQALKTCTITRNSKGQTMLAEFSHLFRVADPNSSTPKIELEEVQLVELEDVAGQSSHSEDVISENSNAVTTSLKKALTKNSVPENVVKLSFPQPEVAVVSLMDEVNRNMFSPELAEGVNGVFSRISEMADVKAVVVTGYGNWFCSGGTPDSLEAIRQGGMSFLDDTFFKSLLDCPLPTIAAMQGHALGGGLTFGLYADLIVMSEYAYFAANFMEHGFTPGVGATLLFPSRFGSVLGNEMMLTARRYQGRELRERGAPMEIVPRDRVYPRALELASLLAKKPILQLKELKAHLAHTIGQKLPAYFQREQAMHDKVFAAHRLSEGEDKE